MKINLLKYFVIDTDTLDRGIEATKRYASTIGLPLDFLFFETSKQFTSIPFSNEVNANGYIVNPTEIFQECKRLGATFDIDTVALLVFDPNKISPQPTNPSENGQNLQIPTDWFATYPDVFALYCLHELSHYFHSRDSVFDLTHHQFDPMWNGQFNQKSHIDYLLFLLQRFMKPTVNFKRIQDNGVETLGELSFESFTCKTLERPWKNNMKNISCVPKGQYEVKWKYFFRKWRFSYQLQNVQNRTGIFFHAGNYVTDVQGCILLGDAFQDINNDGLAEVVNSKITIKKFEDIMNKRDFILNIC